MLSFMHEQQRDPMHGAPDWARHINDRLTLIIRYLKLEGEMEMSTQETLSRLQSDITANTNATQAVQQALTGYAQTITDLTKQLQDAIAGDDEDAIKAAADALEANTKVLMDGVPATAQAALAGTNAASPSGPTPTRPQGG